MPIRRRSMRRRGSSRRRTRWLAIVPDSVVPTSGVVNFQELALQDSSGAVPLAEFYGGTLVKVLLQLQVAPEITIASPAATQVAYSTLHAGIFITPASTPDATVWTPNAPSGDYMIRDSYHFWYRRESDTDGASTVAIGSPGIGLALETKVRRRIVENSVLWLGNITFLNGSLDAQPFGYTGRVLIALP